MRSLFHGTFVGAMKVWILPDCLFAKISLCFSWEYTGSHQMLFVIAERFNNRDVQAMCRQAREKRILKFFSSLSR
jgi:hypothetical protein